MEIISCIIIEDQLPAQRVLQRYIKDLPILQLKASCGDCLKAMQVLNEETVDLIFLDVNLPKISGLNFLRSLSNPPKVIITSAYPQYAIEGFELDVVDYLLKPFSFERFLKSISKLLTTEESKGSDLNKNDNQKFVFIKSDKTIHRINFEEIIYIKSDGDYIRLVSAQKKYFLSQSLSYWNTILPSRSFIQTHKSYIVNLARIDQIRGNEISTEAGIIPIGRSYKQEFVRQLKRFM